MRRAGAAAVAAVIAMAGAILVPAWWVGEAASVVQRGEVSPCTSVDRQGRPLSRRVINPPHILECDTAQVSMTVRASCAAVPLHVMLNIDVSGSMIGQSIEDAKDAAIALVRSLELDEHPDRLVGLVTHGFPRARLESPLTDNAGQVIARIRRLSARGEDNLPDAIDRSRMELVRARQDAPVTPYDVMVILSDGGQTVPVSLAIRAASRAKGAGILIVAVCLENAASSCPEVRKMASGGRYYFQQRSTSGLVRVFRQIADEIENISLRSLTVEETMPEGVAFVADTFNPTPSAQRGRTARWEFRFVPQEGEQITYRVQPHAVATYPLAISTASFTDSQNRRGEVLIPTAVLTVTGPCTTPPAGPTATATPLDTPTPTATWSPAASPTAPSTLTPTASPSAPPAPIYLPVLKLVRCVVRDRPADVVLVIDASTSMGRATSRGRTKLEAAQEGARRFVELMRPVDRVAVIQFNEQPLLLAGLTDDRAALQVAIDAIQMAPWTRLDLALDAATAELSGQRRRPDSLAVIVLLTDGLPSHTTAAAVLEAAERARASARLFAIGLGPDVDRELLVEVAGSQERYYPAEDAEALTGIYEQISEKIPCG